MSAKKEHDLTAHVAVYSRPIWHGLVGAVHIIIFLFCLIVQMLIYTLHDDAEM